MIFPRICVLQGLLCLPLLACTADKDDDSTDTTAPATSTDGDTGTSAATATSGEASGSTVTSDTGTSATATTAESTGAATTGDGTTGEGTTGGVGTTGDGTTGEDTTGDGTTGEGTTTGGPAGLSWAMDVYPVVIAPSCGCHEEGHPMLTMANATDSYKSLVGVHSFESGLDLVMPGDPDKSYLFHKLNGTHEEIGGSGLEMPALAQKLPQDQIDLVAQWISDGALP